MTTDQIAEEAWNKIYNDISDFVIEVVDRDMATSIIKSAIEKAYDAGYMECLNRMEKECDAVESRAAQAGEWTVEKCEAFIKATRASQTEYGK